jgi:hypothetical protein
MRELDRLTQIQRPDNSLVKIDQLFFKTATKV